MVLLSLITYLVSRSPPTPLSGGGATDQTHWKPFTNTLLLLIPDHGCSLGTYQADPDWRRRYGLYRNDASMTIGNMEVLEVGRVAVTTSAIDVVTSELVMFQLCQMDVSPTLTGTMKMTVSGSDRWPRLRT